MEHKINIDQTDCIRTSSDFGMDHIRNVCTGTVVEVAWGTADWFFISAASVLLFLLILMLAACLVLAARSFSEF